jgi:hypothetical protein
MRYVLLLLACSALLHAGDSGKPSYEVIDWSAAAKGQPGEAKGELKHPVKGSSIMRYRSIHKFCNTTPKPNSSNKILVFGHRLQLLSS